jgi:sodium/bile acid cotransporter 7
LVLSQQTEIDVAQQVTKLSLIVVLPLALAQLMRRAGAAAWADRNKPRLSVLGQCGILVMVVFGAAAGASKVELADQAAQTTSWLVGVTLVASAIAVHVTALYLGIVLARGWKLPRVSQIAIGIAGSQKTLMVGLQIAIDCGVSVVPMIIYHLSQLVIDTIVAERWKR